MAAFFVISGYCSSFAATRRVYFKSLFRNLFVPTIVFQVIVLAGIALYSRNLVYFEEGMLHPPYTISWFMWALMISKTLVYLLWQKVKRISHIVILCFVFLVVGCLLYYYHIGINVLAIYHGLIASFFVAVGYYLKANESLYNKLLKYCFWIYPVLIVALRIVNVIPIFTLGIHVSPKTILLFVIVTLAGTAWFLQLCKYISSNRVIEYFGRNSLVVYGLHFLPLYIIVDVAWQWINPSTILGFCGLVICVYTLEYLVCYLMIRLFKCKALSWVIGK